MITDVLRSLPDTLSKNYSSSVTLVSQVRLGLFLHCKTRLLGHILNKIFDRHSRFSSLSAPPTVTSIRLLIPLSCCDAAAPILINALGGEEKAKEIAGGTRWWQVRGLAGVDANWVANKKEWNRADRMRKKRDANKSRASSSGLASNNGSGVSSGSGSGSDLPTAATGNDGGNGANDTYTPDLDPMRCMLYFHGGKFSLLNFSSLISNSCWQYFLGGYFFGSTDQERFCVQRYSR